MEGKVRNFNCPYNQIMPIIYSEYKSLIDILSESSTNENANTYQDLMQKESNVLSTVNQVVKNIQDKKIKSNQFVEMNINDIVQKFFLIWPDILLEIYQIKNPKDILDIITKDDRVIYLGIMMIIIGCFMFFILP